MQQQNYAMENYAMNTYAMNTVRVIATMMGSLLMVLALLVVFKIGASAADVKSQRAAPLDIAQSTAADCSTVTSVSLAECLTLVALFTQTNGTGWISNTNWLDFDSGNAPCDWYGIVCNGGHVEQMLLARNELTGVLPLALGNLQGLTRLRLEKNSLQGRIPPTICALTTHLTDLSLAYNAFFTKRTSVENCLQPLESDWLATQTTTVEDLRLSEIFTDALHLTWTPISYTSDGGYYEIAISTDPDGPFVTHGHTANKSASTYSITGLEPGRTYYIAVRSYTPPHGDQPRHVRSISARIVGVTQALTGRVLVAAYFPADNDLAAEIPYVIQRFRNGTAHNPNVQVVLLVDGRQDGDTRLLEIADGEITITNAVIDEWGVDELDTGDPEVLAWFLTYARSEFPSERNIATLIGHGIPLAPEIAWPSSPVAQVAHSNTPAGEIPPLPKEHEYTPSDITNRGYMSAVDVGQALLDATDQGANPFDIIFFDQCFQGNLEVLYEVRNTARIFIASPNYAWLAAAYDKYISQFIPSATPEEMARAIIDLYRGTLDPRHPNTIFAVRNSDLLTIAAAVNELGDALSAALLDNQQEKIANVVRDSQYVDTTQCGTHNLELGPPDELIGIESLGAGLQVAFGAGDPYGIEPALDALATALSSVQKRTISGSPYIAPDEFWDYGNSLTILAPLPRNSPSHVVWRASIYRDDVPFTARWSVDPSQPVTVTASLAYVREGRWDEFLDAWYNELTPTVGQWCHYIPPEQVVVGEKEVLTLTASALSTDSLQLNWTPTDDTSANEYWLYGRPVYAIGWVVDRIISLSESSVAFSGLDAGSYRYMLLARNEAQELIAQSNEVTVTITGALAITETWVMLPLVIGD